MATKPTTIFSPMAATAHSHLDLPAAIDALRRGALVGMPTETVYGLAANALDATAVLGIFAAKGRPCFDPLIVHVASADQAWTIAKPSPRAELLARHCWPGPLTLVLPRRPCIPDAVTSGLDTVGVRCPAHPLALALIRDSGMPLAAPSANRFGRLSPTTAAAVREQLDTAVEVILDGGPCAVGIESTVLLPDPHPIILRPGGVTRETLEQLLQESVQIADRQQRGHHLPTAALQAPGMLASHYAPRLPLTLRAAAQPWPDSAELGILAFSCATAPPQHAGPYELLSSNGDLVEAATRLFACLRRLDASGAARLMAEHVPPYGLGLGINDRLQRAAGLG